MRLLKCGLSICEDYRLCFFIVALFLYGTLSSPTPDNPNIVELSIAVLFITALGVSGLIKGLRHFFLQQKQSLWQIAGYTLLCYGLVIPSLVTLGQEVSLQVLIRDVIAFGFLCFPVFVVPFLMQSPQRQKVFEKLILFIGLAFALRVVFLDFSFFTQADALLYLANSPLVLLSSIYLVLRVGHKTAYFKRLSDAKWFVIYAMLALLPMLAMYIDFQRASFLAIAFAAISYGLLIFIKTPVRIVLPVCILLALLVVFFPYFQVVIESIVVKTSKVGLNMRYQEAIAVWSVVSHSPFSMLFGLGWGAEFSSPAVGNLNVGYTHSLLTYVFLKAGLIGLGLTLFYLFCIGQKAIKLVFVDPVWGNALIWPFIIPVTLYASYKSLDFGLIMTLIVLMDIGSGGKLDKSA